MAWHTALSQTFKIPPIVTVGLAVGLAILMIRYGGIVGFVVLTTLYGLMTQKAIHAKDQVWRKFAAANDWYCMPGNTASRSLIPPGLPIVGSRSRMGDVVRVEFEGHVCDVFMYHFTTGSGKSRKTHYYTVAHVELARVFPHIIVDSKRTGALINRGMARRRVKLEGNFDQHFSLYCKEDEHILALSVITPDIMQTLIHKNPLQDIEIIGQDLFFMMASDHRSPQALPRLLASVDALADEIAHKAKTIRYKTSPQAATVSRLEEAVGAYNSSGDQLMSGVFNTVLLIVMMPVILIIVIGLFMTIVNGGL